MNRKFIAAIGFVIAVALGLHFYVEWEMARFDASLPQQPAVKEQQDSDDITDDVAEDTAGEHWHDGEWHGRIVNTTYAAPQVIAAAEDPADDADGTSFILPWSNPMMPDEIPEHLKMPPEWVGLDYMAMSPEDEEYAKNEQFLEKLAAAVIENYNPKRPLEEVWPAFTAAEKQLHAASKHAAKYPLPIVGGCHADWFYQSVWNFPEVYETGRKDGRWGHVYDIEMGKLEPDWNLFHLHDGREFRVKHDTFYQFYFYDEELGKHQEAYGYGRGEKETIRVYLDTISAAELERIQGWNYHFNPYTGEPMGGTQ